jgi:hypothetical protein
VSDGTGHEITADMVRSLVASQLAPLGVVVAGTPAQAPAPAVASVPAPAPGVTTGGDSGLPGRAAWHLPSGHDGRHPRRRRSAGGGHAVRRPRAAAHAVAGQRKRPA